MSPDPYAPVGPSRTPVSEVRSEQEQFLARLRDLGATDDEVRTVADHWDDLDPDDPDDPEAFTKARRAELIRSGDGVLLGLIHAGRAEYEHGTTTEDEATAKDFAAAYAAAQAEAVGRIGGNVESVLAWVGGDEVRAMAVLQLETAPEGADRKTLVEPLQELVADPEAPPEAT